MVVERVAEQVKDRKKPGLPTDFPRMDLGETNQFKLTSGLVVIEDQAKPSFCGGRHNFISVADAHPGQERQLTFMCLRCQAWGIFDKDAHVCERGLGG